MVAALGRIDALAFTGGIGEHSPLIRAATVNGLAVLGLAIDPARNRSERPDADLSAPSARARTLAIAAREDIEIARQTRTALGG